MKKLIPDAALTATEIDTGWELLPKSVDPALVPYDRKHLADLTGQLITKYLGIKVINSLPTPDPNQHPIGLTKSGAIAFARWIAENPTRVVLSNNLPNNRNLDNPSILIGMDVLAEALGLDPALQEAASHAMQVPYNENATGFNSRNTVIKLLRDSVANVTGGMVACDPKEGTIMIQLDELLNVAKGRDPRGR